MSGFPRRLPDAILTSRFAQRLEDHYDPAKQSGAVRLATRKKKERKKKERKICAERDESKEENAREKFRHELNLPLRDDDSRDALM